MGDRELNFSARFTLTFTTVFACTMYREFLVFQGEWLSKMLGWRVITSSTHPVIRFTLGLRSSVGGKQVKDSGFVGKVWISWDLLDKSQPAQ